MVRFRNSTGNRIRNAEGGARKHCCCDGDVSFADCDEWVDWLYDHWTTQGYVIFDFDLIDGPDSCASPCGSTRICSSYSGPIMIPDSAITSYTPGVSIISVVTDAFSTNGHCGQDPGSDFGYVFTVAGCELTFGTFGPNSGGCENFDMVFQKTYSMPTTLSAIQATGVPVVTVGPGIQTCQASADGYFLA